MKTTKNRHESEINESLTHYINSISGTITEREYNFLKKAYAINNEQHSFSVGDFPYLSKGSFRQLIHRFRPIIEVVTKSRPCFYKLVGTNVSGDSHKITKRVMGEGMFEILQRVREQPASIHDIKLMFKSSNLHQILLQNGSKPDSSNKGIKVRIPVFHKNITITCTVYPETIQMDIGCSYKPIVYDISGVTLLSSFLGEVFLFLKLCSSSESNIPEVNNWKITHYHFGKDGKETCSGNRFHYTYEEMTEGLVRFYTKIMPDGRTIPRFEQIQTPHNTLDEELENMMMHQIKN